MSNNDEGKIDYQFVHNSKCELISAVERYFRKEVDDDLEGNITNIVARVAYNEAQRESGIPDPEQWVADVKAENTMLKAEIDKLREQRLKDGLAGQAQLDEDGNLISTLKAENELLREMVNTYSDQFINVVAGIGIENKGNLVSAMNAASRILTKFHAECYKKALKGHDQ